MFQINEKFCFNHFSWGGSISFPLVNSGRSLASLTLEIASNNVVEVMINGCDWLIFNNFQGLLHIHSRCFVLFKKRYIDLVLAYEW